MYYFSEKDMGVNPLYSYCTLSFPGNQCPLRCYAEFHTACGGMLKFSALNRARVSVGDSTVLYPLTVSAFGSEGQL